MDPSERSLGVRRGIVGIVPYDPRWPFEFELEAANLRDLLGDLASAIEHIGSTAVPGLAAKPIVDIAIAFADIVALAEARSRLAAAGYHDRGDMGEAGGVLFAKGPESLRTHILHLVEAASDDWLSYLLFRGALNRDTSLRDAYSKLKQHLAARFPFDRGSYSRGKAEFVEEAIAAGGQHLGSGDRRE